MNFADEASKRQPGLTRIEKVKDLVVEFESNPKVQTLVDMLESLHNKKNGKGCKK